MENSPLGNPTDSITTSNHSLDQNATSSSSEQNISSPRRSRIPDKPKASWSLWRILKNYTGGDLTQISLPVNMNEPLSALQRLAEEMEYSQLLDKAASCSCPYEQVAYLAVFIISGHSAADRITKPFNPLLGETFEFDRMKDLGWRYMSEQISHHPPVAATHCEGNGWIIWNEFSFEGRFNGNDIQLIPSGEAHVEFSEGNAFKWNKILTTVHNYIIGSTWVDHEGVVKIIGENKAEGIICDLNFIPYNGSSTKRIKKETRRVKGEVSNVDGVIKWKIEGHCDDQVELTAVLTGENEEDVLGEPIIAWKCNVLPDGSENYYSFSTFACQLNEPEEGVAPTDSRLRPDQRLMEDGKIDEANMVKLKLEDKQRKIRRESETKDGKAKGYQMVWFEPTKKDDGSIVHKFKGDYWMCKDQKDWSRCPHVF